MLKDLQQRQGDQSVESGAVVMPVAIKKTPYKSILLVIVTIVLTLAVVYTLSLYNENQHLKLNSQQKLTAEQATLARENSNIAESLPINKTVSSENKNSDSPVNTQTDNKQLEPRPPLEELANNTVANEAQVHKKRNNDSHEVTQANKTIDDKASNSKAITTTTDISAHYVEIVAGKTTADTKKAPVSMVISRTQLSPEMLAKQKMNRAKEAVANNNITKAEQLFEDVLLVLPSQKDARKQLAALWFGRRSYQASLNLLAQGISLDPTDQELRELKAQIYIKQGQNFQAFKILQSHPNVQTIQDSKYLSMLATQAQASQQFSFAVNAYKKLTELQNNMGRWWLGLAIAYDSSSQFELASQTYNLALNKNDLSDSARQFITQRLQELGE